MRRAVFTRVSPITVWFEVRVLPATSRTEIFLPFVETPRIGAGVCDRSVSANVRSDFGDLLHTFVSGGNPSRRRTRLTVAGETPVFAAICLPVQRWQRSRSISSTMAWDVGCRSRCGRDERSCNPANPSRRYRSTHASRAALTIRQASRGWSESFDYRGVIMSAIG
jgi:hypothetical protein